MPHARLHPVAEARLATFQADTQEASPRFVPAGTYLVSTMSCFLCGKHRPRSQLKTRRFFGRTQQVCGESCEEN